MLVLVLLLTQSASPAAPSADPSPAPTAAAVAPSPTARPAPAFGRATAPVRPKTLSEHAAEMKARGTPQRAVSFDDVATGETSPPEAAAPATGVAGRRAAGEGGSTAASAAQRRMDRAVERGLAVPERASTTRRDRARREWDEAAEACRTTPGCTPHYRDDPRYGADKPLKTDRELIEDVRKRGFSEHGPVPR